MKAEHSQQIEDLHLHYHKLETESLLQLNKITADMQDKITEIKALYSQEIEDLHRYYHQQNSHDHVDHQTQTDYCMTVQDKITTVTTSQQQANRMEKLQMVNNTATTPTVQLGIRSDSDTNIMLPRVLNTEDVPISQLSITLTTPTSIDHDDEVNLSHTSEDSESEFQSVNVTHAFTLDSLSGSQFQDGAKPEVEHQWISQGNLPIVTNNNDGMSTVDLDRNSKDTQSGADSPTLSLESESKSSVSDGSSPNDCLILPLDMGVDEDNDEQQQNIVISLGSSLRPRKRIGAFWTTSKETNSTANPMQDIHTEILTARLSTKSDKTKSDQVQEPKASKSTSHEYSPLPDFYMDIQKAKPCWYCTNLTTLEICDVCGNEQKRETTV